MMYMPYKLLLVNNSSSVGNGSKYHFIHSNIENMFVSVSL